MAAPAMSSWAKSRALTRATGAGAYRTRMRGRGAYTVTNNLITDGNQVVPDFAPSDLHQVTYSNKEFIGDIYAPQSTTGFALQRWAINPGLGLTFPWLSQLAINFVDYELVQLCFTYKSTVADFAAASGQVGQIVMCTQYNPTEAAFQDKEEMMLYEGGSSAKTTENLIHGVECDPSKNAGSFQKFIRYGGVASSEDLKNYDLGVLNLAILNCPATYAGQQLGELWVSYTVKLRKPKMGAALAYNVPRDVFVAKQTSMQVPFGLLNNPNLAQGQFNSLGCTMILPLNTSQLIPVTRIGTTQVGPDQLYNSQVTLAAETGSSGFTAMRNSAALVFPPSFSGNLRVRFIIKPAAANTEAQLFDILSSNSSTIFRMADIPATNGLTTTTWTHTISSKDQAFPENVVYNAWDVTVDLRFLPAANGIQNILYLSWAGTNAGATTAQIEISGYNTSLSVADNGSNDQIALVTRQGSYSYA
jgi:hypothetical protein